MEDSFEKAGQLVEHGKEYIETRISLLKLDLTEKTAQTAGHILGFFFASVLLMSGIILLGVGCAFALTHLGIPLSFCLVGMSLVYMLLGLLLYKTVARWTTNRIANLILHDLFQEQNPQP